MPLDEYSRYVPTIWGLLAEDADSASLAATLDRPTEAEMGTRTNSDATEYAAVRLEEWWRWRLDIPDEPRPIEDELRLRGARVVDRS